MIIHVQLYIPERKKYGRCHLSINANLHLLLMYTWFVVHIHERCANLHEGLCWLHEFYTCYL